MTTRTSHINSLVDVLHRWTVESPDRDACRFLSFGAAPERGVTYQQLVAQARAVGGALQARVQRGDRVILLYAPGLDFVISFLGSFHAGAIAVPVYPPDPAKPGRDLVKLRAIIADAKPAMILSTSSIRRLVAAAGDEAAALNALPWLETNKLDVDSATDWRNPGLTGDDIAFLQYTSGSTGQPKGVMVSHGNLLNNVRCLEQVFEDDASSTLVSWLPLYHDMGLIGNLLHGLYVGTTCLLMSPMEFLEQPLRWLETITKHRAHTSGGPNFAYELCVRKIAAEQRASLDLSSWRVAFNGAEPVRRATLERFTKTFAPHGFRREAFFPCYGLAEATLIVSGSDKALPPKFEQLDTAALEQGTVQTHAAQADDNRAFVACGQVIPGHRLAIVDPSTMARSAPDAIGEIWVAGPSVARGYWNKPEQSAQTFGAMVVDAALPSGSAASPGEAGLVEGDGPFLRTGDLGFVRDGQLFVTGRLKDLIIVRGRNHYPQDLELTAEQAYPGLRPGCGAAFTVDNGEPQASLGGVKGFAPINSNDERLTMVFEIDRKHRDTPIDGIAQAIVQRIAEQHDLELHELVLIEAGRIPKTTSGKIQRSTTRLALAAGKLPVVSRWERPTMTPVATANTDWLREAAARALELPSSAVPVDVPLVRLGMSSLRAVELRSEIARVTGAALSFAELFQAESLAALGATIEARKSDSRTLAPLTLNGPRVLSFAQQRLWLIAQLAPERADYNECLVLRLAGELQRDVLESALHAIVARHDVLRSSFVADRDGAKIRIGHVVPAIATSDVQALAMAERDDEAMRQIRALAAQPFDLSKPPLIRALLVQTDAEHHVLAIVVHHILCDARSAQLLCEELAAVYDAEVRNASASLPALPAQYADLARWEREQLQDPSALLAYWRAQLAHMPTSVALPVDDSLDAASRSLRARFALSSETSTALRTLAAREGVTPSAALLAALFALLQRYAGQDDIPVGMPVSRRERPEAASLIGFFVNTLVMRGDVSGDPTFRELLARTGATVVAGLEHQALPFDALVEALRPERRATQSPLFNVMFSYEGAPMPAFSAGALQATPVALEHETARFDLTVSASDTRHGFAGALELDAARFSAATAARMAQHFERLLAAAIAAPERKLSELAIIDGTDAQKLAARPAWPAGPLAHELVAKFAAETPEAIAIVDGDRALSYAELDRRARQLAHQLRGHGVGPDAIVGVCLERSAELIVSFLAILYAGGAYLPLDPAHPTERVRFLLDDTQAPVVITTDAQLAGDGRVVLAPHGDNELLAPLAAVAPAHLAYVIYTSGSTGQPKGVLIEHGAFAAYLATVRDLQTLTPSDRMLQFTAPTFDVAHQEIFGALTAGATLVLRSADLHASVTDFLDACEHHRLSVVVLPTAFWAYVVTELAARDLVLPAHLRLMFVGGEAMPAEALAAWQTLRARPTLINAYGPTEATIAVTYWTLGATDHAVVDRVPIGAPTPGVDAYVLDAHRRPVPHGVAGELYLGGVQLARGYLRRPELTANAFVDNPFASGRLYRTGDLVRVRDDGNIVFLGRTDHQVKIRGFRIELGEVEAAITSHPAIRDAVVLCLAHQGAATLVAYAVRASDNIDIDAATLRSYLQARLPAPMVPARFAVVAQWPLTSHGKVDRRALAAIETTAVLADETPTLAPRSPIEDLVAGCFRDVLAIARVQPSDDFFALGGHSLLAMRLLSRIHDALGVQLPLRALFEAPTVAGLAQRVELARRDHRAQPALVAERATTAPMSFAQQRLWFLDRLEPGGTLYNMTGGYRLRGALDRDALGRALTALVARHEMLRTQLASVDDPALPFGSAASPGQAGLVGGAPMQIISPPTIQPLPLIDLSALSVEAQTAALHDHLDREGATPFDLARGPLLRTQLLAMADDDHVLVLSMHHAIADGWSISVLVDDLAKLYAAEIDAAAAPAPLAIQYADHARWQRRWLDSSAIEAQLGYWKTRLGGNLPVLQIPAARRRPPVQTFRGATVDFALPAALTQALQQLGQREGATLFMTLMTAFQILLRRYSGQEDILVGTPMAGRTRSETEALIGLFLNTVVIRGDLSGDPTFRALLARIREATLEAWAHQDVPFEKLVEELNPERSLSHAPVFQVMFVLQNTPTPTADLAGVALAQVPLRDRSAKFDLTLSMEERDGALRGSLQYNTDLFDAATVEHLVAHYQVLLDGIVRSPDTTATRFPLTTDAERAALAARNATDAPYPHDRCLDQLFAASAARTPDALAVVSGSRRLSYGELERRRNQVGHALRRRGARTNAAIAIIMDKGWEQIVAMLGVHAAGSAYLPIDPGIPHDRLAYILDHAQVELVVTQPWIDARIAWPAQVQRIVVDDASSEPTTPLPTLHQPDDLAYILYTSGSTGHPKGVALGHRGAVNTVWDINTRFHVGPDDRVIAMSATTFDLSVYDVFGTLGAGAAIVIPDAGSMRDPAHWAQLVRDERVSVWSSVPAYVQMLMALLEVSRDGQLPSLRVIALSGDVLPLALPPRIHAQLGAHVEVVNLGGNTEASIWSVTFPVPRVEPAWASVPYGHPLANQRCYVLNSALVDCPTSVPGDLYFAGVGLAREYWRDEAKTNAYFFAHPETGERIYRTGDLAYWRADGELILLGRSDFQVKVQGFRIEPGEIEAALKKHAAVREAIVLARDDVGGSRDKRLVAYVVASSTLASSEMRTFLAEWLPDYMIPSVFMFVAELPLSANGKIDRKALPAPDVSAQLGSDNFVAPRTPLEQATAALWCEVLGIERVGIHDNFFDLGGHSLLATRLVARLPAALGVELPLRTIFESPTIAEISVAVAQQLASKKDDAHLASLLSELEGLSDAEAEDRLSHPSSLEG